MSRWSGASLTCPNKSCVSDSWNSENDTPDILVKSYEYVALAGRVHEDVTRRCYEETDPVEFRLYSALSEDKIR